MTSSKTSVPRARGGRAVFSDGDVASARAELFSIGQLEHHARALAASHRLSTKPGPRADVLLQRLAHNERMFARAYAIITDAVGRGRRITPAAEWFIDNWPLIEEQIRTARLHLPRGYSRELPRLVEHDQRVRPTTHTPRVYQLALELVSHSHGRIDDEALRAFFAAYQAVCPLRLGELWAIPIMLRLALLEDLRRVVANVTAGRSERERARYWVKRMIDVPSDRREDVVLVLAELVRESPVLTNAFVSELATRLQAQGPVLAIASSWLEQRLAERGHTVAHVFRQASQSQAADQVSIGNSIGGLRFLSATDWQAFVEDHSSVEVALRRDPAGIYGTMDFTTRDRYRHAVEALSRHSRHQARHHPSMAGADEIDVATAVLTLAESAQRAGRPVVEHHIGYWLVDDGQQQLAAAVRLHVGLREQWRRMTVDHALPIYIGGITAVTVVLVAAVVLASGLSSLPMVVLLAVVAALFVATSQLATAAVQWRVTSRMMPALLPRLDFSKGIPAAHRCLVAVPCLLTDADEIDGLVEALELRFLANRDPQLSFALVTDFKDCINAADVGDAALLARATAGVARLNAAWTSDGHAPFLLLHRPRCFNANEGVWMGWERKRGKLEDVNRALRGERGRVMAVVGDLDALATVRSVIVLDSDTMLPRDAGQRLVATLAHPLNTPVYDEQRGRVVRGYAILQPRVGVSMASAARTQFGRLFAGEPGIDPYTRAVSDVYQDLFGEGSFIGKGIYDVDMVAHALHGRFPDNRVLSHDLLEGAYARCGLVSDVMLIEEQPSAHRVDLSRRSRWVRGDWQIASWLLSRVPMGDTPREHHALSALSRWKIVDNLRRSLVTPALLLLLVVGWCTTMLSAAVLTITALVVMVLPGLFSTLTALVRRPEQVAFLRYIPDVVRELARQLVRDVLAVAWLPIDAALAVESMVRAAVRVVVTHRLLLEWRTAADATRAARRDLIGAFTSLWASPVAIVVVLVLVPASVPHALLIAAPLLLLWLAGPALSWWLSEPLEVKGIQLAADDVAFLRQVARRTWRFFQVFTTAADNDLIPDNFQEDPPQGVAHRTSPTNIGLALTATLAAWDFGYIGVDAVIARTSRTLATLQKLPRHRGHFFNWYDTRTLEPLLPLYVSTVDSGNLAGHLITLAAGLDALTEAPLLQPQVQQGLLDTTDLYAAARAQTTSHTGSLDAVREVLRVTATTPSALWSLLVSLNGPLQELPHSLDGDDAIWAVALREHVQAARAELEFVAPWLLLPSTDVTAEQWSILDGSGSVHHVVHAARAAGGAPALVEALTTADARQTARGLELAALAAEARACSEMDVDFLYDKSRRLLSIGKNVADGRIDQNFYDLLASEARLASYIAVARGQLSQDHWFSLGRSLTTSGNTPALLSWSGSMFEYLMPLLIMPTWPRTLLDESYRGVVKRQIEYGDDNAMPWGVSESGYLQTDAQQNYQYRAFGVPGFGYKRGLADDLVVAPYASVMALMIDPLASTANLRRLQHDGRLTAFGFYEAIDYTTARLPPGKTSVAVRSFMAHHQGMSLLSLAYVLLDQPMQRRFLADPAMRATELLLQERVPKTLPIHPHPAEVSSRAAANVGAAGFRFYATANTPRPEVQLLSNGRYHVAVTNAGGGYSRWHDLAVTRWREDPTRDDDGTFIYIKDVETDAWWTAGHQPSLRAATSYEAVFSQGRAELRRFDGSLETHVEIAVSPEDDVELRRISLTNRGSTPRTLEVTSYAEVVLAPAAADQAHPAFSNLFVQTEVLAEQHAILATRRPRSGHEHPPTVLHLMCVHGPVVEREQYETSRDAFLGRGRTPINPRAMQAALANTAGAVLDPIVSVRNTVTVRPHETVRLHLVTGVAATRAEALLLVDKYKDRHSAERVLELSWTDSQVALRRLDTTDVDVQLYERLASHVLYANAAMRAPESVIVKNKRGQSGLWGYGISGDLPIVLVRIGDVAEIALVQHMLKAHAWWRLKGLLVDVVIWNEDPSGYRQALHDQIMALVTAVGDGGLVDRPGGVFVRRSDQMSDEDKTLMQAAARLIVSDSAGPLADQMERQPLFVVPPDVFGAAAPSTPVPVLPTVPASTLLRDHNGYGGFSDDGREYVITTTVNTRTPAPWVNVLANPWFGTVVSESGSAYTWCENAHSYRLTPWSNDPISDPSGEACWLRDDDTGEVWSPTPQPAADGAPYTTRHGFGYSVFQHTNEDGVSSSLSTFVAIDAPIKFNVLTLRNASTRVRHLSITVCFDLVLGALRPANLPYIATCVEPTTGALLASNAYNTEFAERVAFLDCSDVTRTISGDRTEFLGRNGDPARPAALRREHLSGRVGGGLDPCLAMQVVIELQPGQEREVAFTFGSGRDRDDALTLVKRFRGTAAATAALAEVRDHWDEVLGAVNVQTPDAALNALANGWLVYQVMASRLWARSGFYQSGGAFGFRDQLQDAMALVHAAPTVLREQIVRCAAHQFREGDVQHWWHPPSGRGVRTRISDDLLWLPLATCRYLETSGDDSVLDERVSFLDGRAVKADEDSYYEQHRISDDSGTVYEHCVRALDHARSRGEHGLPLMGTGDWNDGMNLVGDHGRGESVWLGMFLVQVLEAFAPVARRRGDVALAERCVADATGLRRNLDEQAWDGDWYKRAWFDDGSALGSSTSSECQIDSLPQSWSVLAGIGSIERQATALASVRKLLVDPTLGVIKLFEPPFDGQGPEPGYIRGYVPGVRENGGQYTHAAVWTAMAFAERGDVDDAWDLFKMIMPAHHGNSAAAIATYKVEPYVVAADVYTNEQHAGRGGWTWYTGSAGWMYRLIVESLLGIHLEVDRLRITPRLPRAWTTMALHYRHHETLHHIHVVVHAGPPTVTRVVCDGVVQADMCVPLHRDGQDHQIEVHVGQG